MKMNSKPALEGLLNLLNKIYPLSSALKTELELCLKHSVLSRHHILLDPPSIANHAYYLHNGFIMVYMYMEEKRVTEAFHKGGEIIVPFRSFFDQVPATQTFQVMIKSEILAIRYDDIQRLTQKFPEAQHIYRDVLYRHYEDCSIRLHELQQLSPGKRFRKLITRYPKVEQYVTQESIASFLGITPSSLSRIKRREM